MTVAATCMAKGVLESHRTLGDGSLDWGFPRHFVPGYDRIVPPGHFAQALASNRDIGFHSPGYTQV